MRHRYTVLYTIVYPFLVLFCAVLPAWAGTTGNLSGKITDITTGEPLPLVNVSIGGSGRGGVTNDKGEYSVVGVTPGTYVLKVSLLGYQPIEGKKVVIEADETAVFNFKLASTDIEVEGVTVEGHPPLVDVTKTRGDQTYNKDKIEQLPNVKGVQDVLGLQAGVVKFGSQLFLRGGRANETQILIDGVAVNDVGGAGNASGTTNPNEQLQQLYSGNSTGGAGGAVSVSANAIQSVSVSSSGLDAEYGNAQSGVVNITTKSGSETYNGSIQYRTDGIGSGGYNERYYAANVGGPEPITAYLLPSIGVEVPGKLTFFMSGNFDQSDGPYAYNTSRFYHPLKRKLRFAGFFGDILSNAGFKYDDKQNNDFSFNTKLSYAIGESDQFAFSYRANANSSHPLEGSYGSKNLYDSTLTNIGLTTQNVLQWTHILGTNSLLKGYVSRLESNKTSSVGDLTPAQYSAITDLSLRDANEDGFNDIGTSQSWSTSHSVLWNVKFDYNSQVHRLHFLKAGAEYNYELIQSTAISFPLDPNRTVDSTQRGAYPGLGLARWVSDNIPSRGAFYLQDNIELTGINVHVGLRYDYFYLGNQVNDPAYVRAYEELVNSESDPAKYTEHAGWVGKSFWKQFTRGNFSPRLSIGYPISTRTVFYFNYGHFLQYPERDQYFHYPVNTTISGNYVGNPSLKPQRTVQYEAGFDQLIFDDLSLGIRGFYKDVFDYATLRRLSKVDQYVNLDYASARGFEIIVTKQSGEHYSGSLGYTFQLAKGRSSDPFAAQASPQLFQLPRETRLDYDQQHTVNLFVGYRVSPKEDYDVLGLNINNWGASVTWNFGSGFPYTPYNIGKTLADLYLKNTGDGPYTSEINVSLYKGFNFFERLNVVFTLDIVNLLDRRNVDLNAGGFNTLTGSPLSYGDYAPDTKVGYTWTGRRGGQSFDSRVPPFVFRSPRQVSLGMRINWD